MEYHLTNLPAEGIRNLKVILGELEAKVIKDQMPKELPKVVIDGKYAYELLKSDLRIERYLRDL